MARLLLALVAASLLAVLGLVLARPEPMLAPGILVTAHENLSSDCFACHTPWLGTPRDKCVACHTRERIGLFTTRGTPLEGTPVAFHQSLIEEDCAVCHTDHAGATAMLRQFSHELLREDARGRCAGCHGKPDDGLHRRLEGNCSACHSPSAWTPAQFDHDKHFRMDRDHDVACRTCHVDPDYGQYTCYGCHEHTPAGIRAEHAEEGIRDFGNCAECHRSADEPEGDDDHD